MDKIYKVIKKDQTRHMTWSGGKMAEIYIYPETAKFEGQNFIFNLCTATVEVEKSIFTVFPNYNRILMTLDNQFNLIHNDDGNVVKLTKYQPHTFYGGDKTIGYGKLNDYNFVMDREHCTGDLQAISLAPGSILYSKKGNYTCTKMLELFYIKSGTVTITGEENSKTAETEDLIIFDHSQEGRTPVISNRGPKDSIIIIATAHIF